VYILRCRDGTYYTGVTSDVTRRIAEHTAGINECYTFTRRPVVLMYAARFPTPREAISFEKQLKGWSRAKKEALMRGDWVALKTLSRSRNRASTSSA
jgi:predicted GIY-YIG superfamily endonuclease